jgi:hypothetical protein
MSSRTKFALIAVACLVAVLLYTFVFRKPAPVIQCDSALWEHVYRPQRLYVLDPCITVTGIIEEEIQEQDGDTHLRLKLDSQFEYMLNERNRSSQYGNLVLEVICQSSVAQADAVSACEALDKRWEIPSAGTHVQVTGPYVLDTQHGWNEIHPVNSIRPE